METKLDSVLKNFAETPNLPNYRKRSMLARGAAGAGASVLGVALASILKDDPELMNLSWVAAPATGLLVGAKRSRDFIRFADIGRQKPFPNPDVLTVYVDDKGYAIGAIKKYKGKDMSVTTPTHPYEKLRYLPLEVQNKLFDEVLTPGIPNLRAKYSKINDLYADLDPRDKKEFKAYVKEVHGINRRSEDAYDSKKQNYAYQLERPIIDHLMKEALKSSIDEAYERAKKEGTLLK